MKTTTHGQDVGMEWKDTGERWAKRPPRQVLRNNNTLKVISLAALIGAWELVGSLDGQFFATPGSTLVALWRLTLHGDLAGAAWNSLEVFFLGFVVAVVAGIVLGCLAGYYQPIGDLIDTPVTIFWSTPVVALIPLMVLWLGLTMTTQLLIVFLATLFPVEISTQVGVKNVPKIFLDVSRSFGKGRALTFWRVILPAAAPEIGSGIRLGVGRAIIGVFVAELFTAITGLGADMEQYSSYFQIANYFAALLVFIVMSVLTTTIVSVLTRRWLRDVRPTQ